MPKPAPISVVIPAHNSENYVREAIESVFSQTLHVSEIIVVDDGSTDRTAELATSLGAIVIRQPHKGVSAARNVGVRAASQPWIALLDADDIWEREKIEFQWNAIQLHPDAALVYCDLSVFVDPSCTDVSIRRIYSGRETEMPTQTDLEQAIRYYPRVPEEFLESKIAYCPTAVMIRRDALIAVGLFDEALHYYEDYECFLRISTHYSLIIVERPLARLRVHGANSSNNRLESNFTFIKLIDLLNQYPEKYPAGTAQALDNSRYWPIFVDTGRGLLATGRRCDARFAFARHLERVHSLRVLLFWGMTFLGPASFKKLLNIKRKFLE